MSRVDDVWEAWRPEDQGRWKGLAEAPALVSPDPQGKAPGAQQPLLVGFQMGGFVVQHQKGFYIHVFQNPPPADGTRTYRGASCRPQFPHRLGIPSGTTDANCGLSVALGATSRVFVVCAAPVKTAPLLSGVVRTKVH